MCILFMFIEGLVVFGDKGMGGTTGRAASPCCLVPPVIVRMNLELMGGSHRCIVACTHLWTYGMVQVAGL